MRDFHTLKVWERAHRLVIEVYRLSESFPPAERHGLIAQLRRAAVSIPTNIAEGCGRRTERELARFLDMAMGSASELEYLLLLSHDLGLLEGDFNDRATTEVQEIKRMLAGLLQKLIAEG